MSNKDRLVVFRVSEEFYAEFINAQRQLEGFPYASEYLRYVLEQFAMREKNMISQREKRAFDDLCYNIELIRINLDEVNLRTFDPQDTFDVGNLNKLSSNANALIKAHKKRYLS